MVKKMDDKEPTPHSNEFKGAPLIEKELKAVAISMLKRKLSLKMIVQATGLSEKELIKLKAQI